MIGTRKLIELARLMGITLVQHTGGPKGFYQDKIRRISTRRGMSNTQFRSTLAHELGHAHYQDTPQTSPACTKHHEVRADSFAAHLLIQRAAFNVALAEFPGDMPAVAKSLGVTRHLLAQWNADNP